MMDTSVNCISIDSAKECIDRIGKTKLLGAKSGVHFIIGVNGVCKLMDRKNAAVVCICRDSPLVMKNLLINSSKISKVPIIYVPRAASMLFAKIFKIKRLSCFAVPSTVVSLDTEEELNGVLDGIREELIAMAHFHMR